MALVDIADTGQAQQNVHGVTYQTFTASFSPKTTTTLAIPSTVDTGWTSDPNPASVTAGSTPVTSGTITITVNGVFFCQYGASAQTGCNLANLPAGTDHIQASYSGSSNPWFEPSATSVAVNVIQVRPPGLATAPNWAGYVATSDTYSAASASWTVPKTNCGNFPTGDAASSSATWVGIDGSGNGTVEQIGTDSDCASFAEEYHAWWQMYPSPPHYIGIPGTQDTVAAGDVMRARVTSTGTPGTYTLTISDDTKNWSYSTTQSNSAATGGSAECIEEQPDALSIPLSNFGSVTFRQCEFTGSDGVAEPVWDHPSQALNMVSGGTTKATVSSLSNDGKDFTVTWVHG
jgi:hypothetical protein